MSPNADTEDQLVEPPAIGRGCPRGPLCTIKRMPAFHPLYPRGVPQAVAQEGRGPEVPQAVARFPTDPLLPRLLSGQIDVAALGHA